ncbi:hypothetical protein CEXT_681151 [Caerostris extrusa]|uniref:Uncharacterized protein n=1 Tax=Caerostris extrusa TaxID=172846 RepID=A0AAV4RAX2_CAEEX|nr:hypothetical protein CEXT_681151 [Caerostris extrusa]
MNETSEVFSKTNYNPFVSMWTKPSGIFKPSDGVKLGWRRLQSIFPDSPIIRAQWQCSICHNDLEANGLKGLASPGHEGKLCWETVEAWRAEKEIRFSHFVAAILGGKMRKLIWDNQHLLLHLVLGRSKKKQLRRRRDLSCDKGNPTIFGKYIIPCHRGEKQNPQIYVILFA